MRSPCACRLLARIPLPLQILAPARGCVDGASRQLNAIPSFLEPTLLAMARRHTVQDTFKQHSNISPSTDIHTLEARWVQQLREAISRGTLPMRWWVVATSWKSRCPGTICIYGSQKVCPRGMRGELILYDGDLCFFKKGQTCWRRCLRRTAMPPSALLPALQRNGPTIAAVHGL